MEDGLQDTYTIRSGPIPTAACNTSSLQPARMGSNTITSGLMPCLYNLGIFTAASPTINSVLSYPFRSAFFFASLMAGSTISIPMTCFAL